MAVRSVTLCSDMSARLLLPFLLAASLVVAQTPVSKGIVVNSASLSSGALAPGTLAMITGSHLSERTESASDGRTQELPTKLGGVQVFLYGNPLPLLSVSPTQVQFQVPYNVGAVSSGTIYVLTENDNGRKTVSQENEIKIEPAAPGIFAFGGSEPRAGLILHAQAGGDVQAGSPVTADSPARAGESVIIWTTGLGSLEEGSANVRVKAGTPLAGPDVPVANMVEAFVDGRYVPVTSAVLPQGAIGIYEVRVQLPDDLPSNPKAQLSFMQNGYRSNIVVFPLQSSSR